MMSAAPTITGFCPPRFNAVAAAFATNFAEGLELGARFSLCLEGELVVDLWAGHADRAQTLAFSDTTLTSIFSTTKALTAMMIARLVDQGRLSYDQPVASIWPAFGQAGKAQVNVGQVMSHQAGLCGFVDPIDPALWFDWDALCARLAAMEPLWPPGTASGYHPVTFGYLAGEIFRRVDGRTLGRALHEDVATPLGLDLWIGLPDAEHGRCADVRRPSAAIDLGAITQVRRAAFLERWSSPSGRSLAEWRRVEIPSANGHATAAALARFAGALACDGVLDGRRLLSASGVAALSAERICGEDLVLPYRISWGAGLIRNQGLNVYGPSADSFGHSGWGGSCLFADPKQRLSAAYVMNRQSSALIGDARAKRLIDAAYSAL
jgi:CubicO group peptidase (beta-lactamase class C family)